MDTNARSVVLLGAGFSFAATKGACPLTSHFLRGVDRERFPSLHRVMSSLPKDCQYDLARVVEDVDTCEQLSGVMRTGILPAGVSPEAVRRDLQWYSISILSGLRASICESWPLSWLVPKVVIDGATLITTNYDSIAEGAMYSFPVKHRRDGNCPQCKMKEILKTGCPCPPAGVPSDYWRGSLLKLHGSVCWSMCRQQDCCSGCMTANCVHKPHSICSRCEVCCGPADPVIVLPRLRGKYEKYPKLEAMWGAAALALKEVEVLHVFGFSFSEVDRELCKFLQVCFQSRTLKEVRIIDVRPEDVAGKLRKLLPPDFCPEILGLRTMGFALPSFDDWVSLEGRPLAA